MNIAKELETSGNIGMRKYLSGATMGSGSQENLTPPRNCKEFLERVGNPTSKTKLSMYAFDTATSNGIMNILNEFGTWLMPHVNPKYFLFKKMDRMAASYFQYRVHALAFHYYGDPNLFYLISLFNDFIHPSDLSKDRLMKGIYVLNDAGIEAMEKILVFKLRKEYTYEEDGMFGDVDF